jgi:hypothetical protein
MRPIRCRSCNRVNLEGAGMDKSSPPVEYLWSLAVPRWNSAIGIGVTAFFGMFVGVLLARSGSIVRPSLSAGLFWLIIATTLIALRAFGRFLLNPPIALAATKEGLMTFWRPEQMTYAPPGLLIPWHTIEALSYKSYVTSQRTRMHALIVQCQPDSSIKSFDVWSENLGRETVNRLTSLRSRYSQIPRS